MASFPSKVGATEVTVFIARYTRFKKERKCYNIRSRNNDLLNRNHFTAP